MRAHSEERWAWWAGGRYCESGECTVEKRVCCCWSWFVVTCVHIPYSCTAVDMVMEMMAVELYSSTN